MAIIQSQWMGLKETKTMPMQYHIIMGVDTLKKLYQGDMSEDYRLISEENELYDLIDKRNRLNIKIDELYKKISRRYSGKGCEPVKGEDD